MKKVSEEDLDRIFEELDKGDDQSKVLIGRINERGLLGNRFIYKAAVYPKHEEGCVTISAVINGGKFRFDKNDSDQKRWINIITNEYRKIPGFFDLEIKVNLESLAAIEEEWGSFENYYR